MKLYLKATLQALAALLGLATTPLAAAPVASPHAATELVAETTGVAPGSTVWVAVAQTFDKGWHSYWRNPGDAGEATTIAWSLPTGWRAGDIVWPAPKRLPVGPIMNYGYEGAVILATPLQIPADARPGQNETLSAKVNFLVCAEVCVPDTANVTLVVPVVAGAPAADPVWGAKIAHVLDLAPKAGAISAVFQDAKDGLKLAFTGAPLAGAPDADAYFYPFGGELIDHAKPQVLERGPGGLTLTLVAGPDFAKTPAPTKVAGVLAVDGKAYEVSASPGVLPAQASGLGGPGMGGRSVAIGVLLAMMSAFVGGVILNLMPCVFPILSMKALALATHGADAANSRRQALAFLAGVVGSFVALAAALLAVRAAGEAVGWGFQLQSPMVVAGLGLIMLAAGLNLSGLFEIGASLQGLGAGVASRGDWLGSVVTGALAVVVAAPCTAPFMGPALGFALAHGGLVTVLVFAALGLGFGTPFVALAFSPGVLRLIPRPGAWMAVFKAALAFPMFAAAAWLAWVFALQTDSAGLARLLAAAVTLGLAAWLFGLAQHRRAGGGPGILPLGLAALATAATVVLVVGRPYMPPAAAGNHEAASAGELPSQAWSPETLASLRAAHKPVFINFTAAWCVTCQVNERVAFSNPAVIAAFKRAGAVYLVGDWTNRDGAIAKALSDQGRIGVPLYLYYNAKGDPVQVLPQLLTPAIVEGALAR